MLNWTIGSHLQRLGSQGGGDEAVGAYRDILGSLDKKTLEKAIEGINKRLEIRDIINGDET